MDKNWIDSELESLRNLLNNHNLYSQLNSIDDVKVFMESHVYAVWDFMSLLKALQHNLTGLSLPWKPKANPIITRFINEIVLGEECDLDGNGNVLSHFKMYLSAMDEIGADVTKINQFVNKKLSLESIQSEIELLNESEAVKEFLSYNFSLIIEGENHKIASAFTFGREDVIPDMFLSVLNNSNSKNIYPQLKYYFERHIELDGDEHGPLALKMIEHLCAGDENKWIDVIEVAKKCLELRISLWDSIENKIIENKSLLES